MTYNYLPHITINNHLTQMATYLQGCGFIRPIFTTVFLIFTLLLPAFVHAQTGGVLAGGGNPGHLQLANAENPQYTPDMSQEAQGATRKRNTRDDWDEGESTGKAQPFTLGRINQDGCDYWVEKDVNPVFKNKQKDNVFFAYVLGKENHTSALVKAHTVVQDIDDENKDAITFEFDVIKGQIDGDCGGSIDFMTELTPPDNFGGKVAIRTNSQTLPEQNSQDFDNIYWGKEKTGDVFLNKYPELPLYLPSHLLYSPEDYTWDAVRLKLVKNGGEELAKDKTREVLKPYQDVCDSSAECTIGEMFKKKESQQPINSQRTPILFIHGWQGDLPNAFEILHEYEWLTSGDLGSRPVSGENYWRNLLTYMYRLNYDKFAKYKPYIYHYPSYKHVKFNARILKELLDELAVSGDEVIKNGIKAGNLIIVAHSMGTIVSRSLMEEFGYLDHVKRFISLAGVHHGSPGSVASLVDTSIMASFIAGKDLYTPGACDLMSDNYDGLIDTSIKSDIQKDADGELLEQRAASGSVFTNEETELLHYGYDPLKPSFDRFYLKKLGVVGTGRDLYVRTDMEVPVFPNPWLLNLNQTHYLSFRDKTKDKYYFYAGYVVADLATGDVPRDTSETNDPLADDAVLDEKAAIQVAHATGYNYIDAVVPVSAGILDTSRGRLLLADGKVENYSFAESMPGDLAMSTDPKLDGDSLYKDGDTLVRGTNDWGAKFRLFGDYNHDRLLNGGYTDIKKYRNGSGSVGSAHQKFNQYFASVTNNRQPLVGASHFANDPLFLQIASDLDVEVNLMQLTNNEATLDKVELREDKIAGEYFLKVSIRLPYHAFAAIKISPALPLEWKVLGDDYYRKSETPAELVQVEIPFERALYQDNLKNGTGKIGDFTLSLKMDGSQFLSIAPPSELKDSQDFTLNYENLVQPVNVSFEDTPPQTDTNESSNAQTSSERYKQVSSGGGHTCALKEDGSIVCWGNNEFEQSIPPAGTFTQVSSGGDHTCALKTDGSLACWGGWDDNQFGVATPPTGSFKQVSSGKSHSCALRTDGGLECWGIFSNSDKPTPREGIFTQISSGLEHACALKTDGSLVCWGNDYYGQATPPAGSFIQVSGGYSYTCALKTDGSLDCWGSKEDKQVKLFPTTGSFKQISSGPYHACALKTDGSLYCWGEEGAFYGVSSSVGNFMQVSSGNYYTCALKTDGSLACWGGNIYGQTTYPASVFTQISSGGEHVCALRKDSSVVCWGHNTSNRVAPIPTGSFIQVSSGEFHTCAIKTDGSLVCWGEDNYYYDYSGDTLPVGSFMQVSSGDQNTCAVKTDGSLACYGSYGLGPGGELASPLVGSFTQVSNGNSHVCALKVDGSLVCWGVRWGYDDDQHTPFSGGNFTQVSCGDSHTCALRTDGSLACWGFDRTTTPPVGSFTQVSSGYDSACALKTDGTLVCWGESHVQTTPPNGLFTQISSNCALRVDGTVICWGGMKVIIPSATSVSNNNTTPQQPVVSPTILSVTPTTAMLDTPTTFTFTGNNLVTGMGFTIADCEQTITDGFTNELAGGTDTQRQFQCIPRGTAGMKTGLVKNKPGGTVLHTFTVEVNGTSATAPQITSVTPTNAVIGATVTFTVTGTHLYEGMGFTVGDCVQSNIEVAGGTDTQRQFTCTQQGTNETKRGLVKDFPGGNILHHFNVEVIDSNSGGNTLATLATGETQAFASHFTGGIAINGGEPQPSATLNLADSVEVSGQMTVDVTHVGQVADLVVYAAYQRTPTDPESYYYMLGISDPSITPWYTAPAVLWWDQNPGNLAAVQTGVTLPSELPLTMYQGHFIAPGYLKVHFGYRLLDGTLVVNVQPIEITID